MKRKMECKKHNHQSNHGVCPSCLRDKLSRLPSATVPYYVRRRSPPWYSSSSSTTNSFPASPRAAVNSHRRGASMSFAVREALSDVYGSGLKKSRSMAFAPRNYVAGDTTTAKKKSTTVKKLGFWTKLLHFRGKVGGNSDGGLFHTRQIFHH